MGGEAPMTAKKGKRRPLTRSEIMSRIRRRDTSPERALRSALWELGLRYRVDLSVEGVHVDVAFPLAKAAVFVDGCFWHSCPEHGTKPRSNKAYWLEKLRRNMERDQAQERLLREAGWHVLRFWEHQCLADPKGTASIVCERLPVYGPSTQKRAVKPPRREHRNI